LKKFTFLCTALLFLLLYLEVRLGTFNACRRAVDDGGQLVVEFGVLLENRLELGKIGDVLLLIGTLAVTINMLL
jgi:hypothetical protein